MSRVLTPIAVVLALTLPVGSTTAIGTVARESVEEVIRTAREHRVALERLLTLQETDRERAEADLVRRRALAAQGFVARREVAVAEERAASAAAAVGETRSEIARSETLITEARASLVVAVAPPAPGEERHAPDHIAYGGGGPWSLGRVPALERFFAARFGRPLPVSAYGQTRTHDALGFDHRHAVDVAVHPDTAEGRALVAWLKAERIPFIAFRAAEPGVSTGAHVHVGEASPRVPATPRSSSR